MVDYIVIGQGIAGTCLAYELLKAGKAILVIDKLDEKSSSRVAAGIFNPMVFKRLTKSWNADKAIQYLYSFYPELEGLTGNHFFYPKDFIRIFGSDFEREQWSLKRYDSNEGTFLGDQLEDEKYPFGAGKVNSAGFVDVTKLLDGFKSYLKKENKYLENNIDYDQISIVENSIKISINKIEIEAKAIVFCEGANGVYNPWFDWLPYSLVKGDVLDVQFENFKSDQILNKGCFMLPKDLGIYKVGSTYDWKDLSNEPSQKARLDILSRMEKITNLPYNVINQVAGIRPASRDRRAFLGRHPKYNQLHIFNGLGTKGVMLGPILSKQMVDFLVNDKELEKEVDIRRYFKLFATTNE